MDNQQYETGAIAASGLLVKLIPAGVGAAIMACVDHPKDRREFFARVLVAFAFGYYLRASTIDFLHSFSLFAWLDRTNDDHKMTIAFLLGAVGWSVLGALAMLLKRFRNDPIKTIEDGKKVMP